MSVTLDRVAMGILARQEIARRERLKRLKEECEADLLEFGRAMWNVLEPSKPMSVAWPLRVLCDTLMAITDGHHQKVIFNIPPGSGKSLWLSVLWPAWEWGPQNMPHLRYLSASYSQGLPERDNSKFSRLINSPDYQRLWGDKIKLVSDGKELVENSATGWKRVTSTRSGTTGHRADRILCLPFESRIITSHGYMRVGEVVQQRINTRIAGWDGQRIVWQVIEEYEINPPGRLVEIGFGGGNLRCTADHRVWVEGRGYIPAGAIAAGDALLCWVPRPAFACGQDVLLPAVQGSVPDARGDCGEHVSVCGLRDVVLSATGASRSECQGRDMQPGMLATAKHWREQPRLRRRVGSGDVHPLWQDHHAQTQGGGAREDLLHLVREPGEMGGQDRKQIAHRALRRMWRIVQAGQCGVAILLSALSGGGPRTGDEWRGEPEVRNRWPRTLDRLVRYWREAVGLGVCFLRQRLQTTQSQHEILFADMPSAASWRQGEGTEVGAVRSWPGYFSLPFWLDQDLPSGHPASRRQRMPNMWTECRRAWQGAPRSPYRLPEGQPGCAEPDYGLPVLSREDAWQSGVPHGMARAIVRSVVHLTESVDPTFNLRVAPCHNYFAEGVLVHNCDDANDPMNVESDEVRNATVRWLTEIAPDRLTSLENGVFINLQQRTHQNDATGTLAATWEEFVWIMIPLEFDPLRATPAVLRYDEDGSALQTWTDPRGLDDDGTDLEGLYRDDNGNLKIRMGSPMARVEGELIDWPERYPAQTIPQLKKTKGAYAWASQYQQSPTVRGGGIIRNEWWNTWDSPILPDLGTVVGSLDTAIKEGEQNDYNAFTSWGAFADRSGVPKLILTSAWQTRCSLAELIRRTAESCYERKVDYLLIEDKARGHDVAQEIVRQYSDAPWQTVLIPANGRGAFSGDKRARLEAVSAMFSGDVQKVPIPGDPTQTMDRWTGGMIYAPYVDWAEEVIQQVCSFPAAAHDDFVDSTTQALAWIRRNGVVVREVEHQREEREARTYRRKSGVPYAIT